MTQARLDTATEQAHTTGMPRSQPHGRRPDHGHRMTPRPETGTPAAASEKQPPQSAGHASATSMVHKAVEELKGVIHGLQKTLRELEEAMHLLEAVEEEKDIDERELESLRRTMNHLNRSRQSEPARAV